MMIRRELANLVGINQLKMEPSSNVGCTGLLDQTGASMPPFTVFVTLHKISHSYDEHSAAANEETLRLRYLSLLAQAKVPEGVLARLAITRVQAHFVNQELCEQCGNLDASETAVNHIGSVLVVFERGTDKHQPNSAL
jgi:hypothetical protein